MRRIRGEHGRRQGLGGCEENGGGGGTEDGEDVRRTGVGARPRMWTTTGIAFFAECLRHSANAILHSAKSLPSVTLGKKYSANILSANGSLSSTFFVRSAKTLPSVEKHSTN
jgi:hypothetical protein